MSDDDLLAMPQEEVNKLRNNVNKASKYLLFVIMFIVAALAVFAFVWTRVLNNDFPIRFQDSAEETVAAPEQ